MKLLICDISGEMQRMIQKSDAIRVNSPVQCLDRAITECPDAVVVRFGDIALRERDALIELCGVLRQNPYTKGIGVIALLSSKHRGVMERLRDAGVEYVRFYAIGTSPQAAIDVATMKPEPKDQVNSQLEILCPYLHYSTLDSRHEMTICGAYLDRMVLGGARLHGVCEARGHRHCAYFLNPRCCS